MPIYKHFKFKTSLYLSSNLSQGKYITLYLRI